MKKIFTLLFSIGIVGSVFAQSGRQDRFKVQNDIAFNKAPSSLMYNNSSFHDPYSLNSMDKDRKIREINREFDRQIMAIKFNRHMRPFQKDRQIRMLESMRDQQIRELNHHSDYHNRNDGFNHKW